MKKIICIGECALYMILDAKGNPLGNMPGGRILEAAAILARERFKVIMASEAARDPIGDIIASYLSESGVDITSLDRFTEGHTPVNIFVSQSADALPGSITRYEDYPDECFDIVWPRVEEGDIILFGGHYALDARMRTRLSRFLNHCVERKAILVYMPGFNPVQQPRVTRVMPEILENLELANIVIARNIDLQLIFGIDSSDDLYHNHIDFYCRSLITVDVQAHRISYYSGKEVSSIDIPADISTTLMWNAGAAAGVVAAIAERKLDLGDFEAPDAPLRQAIIEAAAASATQAAGRIAGQWQKI